MPAPITPYVIVLEPSGPVANQFLFLDQALETACQLRGAGHKIRAISRGTEIIEGEELETLMGPSTVPPFRRLRA